jgi:hypothetical protein
MKDELGIGIVVCHVQDYRGPRGFFIYRSRIVLRQAKVQGIQMNFIHHSAFILQSYFCTPKFSSAKKRYQPGVLVTGLAKCVLWVIIYTFVKQKGGDSAGKLGELRKGPWKW